MPTATPQQHQIETLYADHHGWLRAWLRRKLGCAEQASDLAHDTFVRILAARDTLVGIKEPRAYLTTTARHLMLDRARRKRLEQAYLEELSLLSETQGCAPAPEEVLMALEALGQISAALGDLPGKAGRAFVLHYLDLMPQSEVAAQLGVSVRMVQKYLAQALLQCSHALEA